MPDSGHFLKVCSSEFLAAYVSPLGDSDRLLCHRRLHRLNVYEILVSVHVRTLQEGDAAHDERTEGVAKTCPALWLLDLRVGLFLALT